MSLPFCFDESFVKHDRGHNPSNLS